MDIRKQSKRIYIYWGIALTLLVTAGLVCWQVVVPVMRVRAALRRLRETAIVRDAVASWDPNVVSVQIAELGGSSKAFEQLCVYAQMPPRVAPDHGAAVLLMGHCGEVAAHWLARHMGDEQLSDASRAALSKMGTPAVPALVAALQDEPPHVRYWVAFLLGESGDARAIAPLIRALSDNDEDVRHSAAEALGTFGAGGAPHIRQVAGDPDWRVREGATWALRDIKDAHDGPLLTRLLGDEAWQVRRAAACALAEIRYAPAADALLARLADAKERALVRTLSGWALARIGDRRAVEPLLDMLKHRDKGLRALSAEALGDLRAPVSVSALLQALNDAEPDVRRKAARALGQFSACPRGIVPALEKVMRDKDAFVRATAAEALSKIRAARGQQP